MLKMKYIGMSAQTEDENYPQFLERIGGKRDFFIGTLNGKQHIYDIGYAINGEEVLIYSFRGRCPDGRSLPRELNDIAIDFTKPINPMTDNSCSCTWCKYYITNDLRGRTLWGLKTKEEVFEYLTQPEIFENIYLDEMYCDRCGREHIHSLSYCPCGGSFEKTLMKLGEFIAFLSNTEKLREIVLSAFHHCGIKGWYAEQFYPNDLAEGSIEFKKNVVDVVTEYYKKKRGVENK